MDQPMDFLALSLVAALSVTVGLTSAGYGHEPGEPQPDALGNLAGAVAAVLGLDPGQVANYLQGHRSEIRFGGARLFSSQG